MSEGFSSLCPDLAAETLLRCIGRSEVAKLRACPNCGWRIVPIVYGLPRSDDLERDDIILGGCLIDDFQPEFGCRNCPWAGTKDQLHLSLAPRMWVFVDDTRTLAPIGLVSIRFDEVLEVFSLGRWLHVTFTQQYQEWLDSCPEKPITMTALFGDLSPGLIATMRTGAHYFDGDELYEAGFEEVSLPPKFDFGGLMQRQVSRQL